MTTAILQAVSGMSRQEAIKVLAAAIAAIAADIIPGDLPGHVRDATRIVPMKKRKNDPYAPIWEYLRTVTEYATGKALHAELIAIFGKEKTPALSNLYKHLKANGGKQ